MLEKNAGDESQNLLTWFLSPIYLQAALVKKESPALAVSSSLLLIKKF